MYILSPMFTILFCVFLLPDSHIFEPTFLYKVTAWDAWLTGGRAIYSTECLRVMWLGGLIVVWQKMTDYTLIKTFVSHCMLLNYRWL